MSKGGTLLNVQGAIFRGEKRASFADETGFPQRGRTAWGEKKKNSNRTCVQAPLVLFYAVLNDPLCQREALRTRDHAGRQRFKGIERGPRVWIAPSKSSVSRKGFGDTEWLQKALRQLTQ